jgi:hypothetical protein
LSLQQSLHWHSKNPSHGKFFSLSKLEVEKFSV